MKMTLTISNPDQLQHGVTVSHQFDNRGGMLGSVGADWLLIDRERRILPIHCEIRWREKSFCAVDRCGQTFLNDNQMSLAGTAAVRLQEGDCLRIGAYRVLVHYHRDPPSQQASRGALEELFEPGKRLLDALVNDLPAGTLDLEPAAPTCPAVLDICQAFKAASGCDPLLALEAPSTLHPAGDTTMTNIRLGEKL